MCVCGVVCLPAGCVWVKCVCATVEPAIYHQHHHRQIGEARRRLRAKGQYINNNNNNDNRVQSASGRNYLHYITFKVYIYT